MPDAGPLHEAIADALWRRSPVGRLIDNPLSDLVPEQQDEYRQQAAAVLRVVGTHLTLEIEALPGYGRGDNGESLPDGHLLPRADVLAVVDALLEHPDAH